MSQPVPTAAAYLVLARFSRNVDFWFGGVFESESEARQAWASYIENEAKNYDVEMIDIVEVQAFDYAAGIQVDASSRK